MPTVRVRVPLPLPAAGGTRTARVTLRSELDRNLRVPLPIAPVELDNDGLADDWEQVGLGPDAGPALARRARGLHTITMSCTLIERHPGWDVERLLQALRALARPRAGRCTWDYGPSEQGWWRLTGLGWRTVERGPDDAITEAAVALTLTRDWGEPPKPVAPKPTPPPAPPPEPAERTWTVKAGDTLWAIAQSVYGDGNRWPEIASANGVADPRRLAIGLVLRIP